jgi:hypothetical protein
MSVHEGLKRALGKVQAQSGDFPLYSERNGSLTSSPSAFATSLVLCAIGDSLGKRGTKALQYLAAEVGVHGTLNYWERKSERFKAEPYPDDLDDTACAIAATLRTGGDVSGEWSGQFARALITCETKPGGPYRTWLVPQTADAAWKDVDPAVNANIRYALSLLDTTLEGLDSYLQNAPLRSPYYVGPLPVAYFMARAGIIRKDAIELARASLDSESLLHCALSVCILLHSGIRDGVREAIDRLLVLEETFEPLIIESSTVYSGSPAICLALKLEALALWTRAPKSDAKPVDDDLKYDCIFERLSAAPETIRSVLEPVVRAFLNSKHGAAIARLGDDFAKDLGVAPSDPATRSCVFGWIGYTLLDDIYDGDRGPELLPLALWCVREISEAYESYPSEFRRYVTQTLDSMDEAAAWELTYARSGTVPDWGDLALFARRSFGHALGPLSMLSRIGFGPESEVFQRLAAYFFHYLIARQLNDDLHDWREDIESGVSTAVTSHVIQGFDGHGDIAVRFWESTAPHFADRIILEVELATEALKECEGHFSTARLRNIVEGLATAARALQAERANVLGFIEAVAT